jgi:hypothetical protein
VVMELTSGYGQISPRTSNVLVGVMTASIVISY